MKFGLTELPPDDKEAAAVIARVMASALVGYGYRGEARWSVLGEGIWPGVISDGVRQLSFFPMEEGRLRVLGVLEPRHFGLDLTPAPGTGFAYRRIAVALSKTPTTIAREIVRRLLDQLDGDIPAVKAEIERNRI